MSSWLTFEFLRMSNSFTFKGEMAGFYLRLSIEMFLTRHVFLQNLIQQTLPWILLYHGQKWVSRSTT